MAFFNKKEDVIDIKLTQYGKHLLSKGQFRPSSYAFFDDNVLYDSTYAGISSEDQNEIEPRIQEDTPALRTQHIFYGAETEIRRIAEEMRGSAGQVPSMQPVADKHYALSAPLGTSALHTTNMPAWQVRFLGSELKGTVGYSTGSHPTSKIPQLTSELVYKTEVRNSDSQPEIQAARAGSDQNQEYVMSTGLFQDGTYFHTIGDQLLIEIDEKNTDFEKGNFIVEVFEIEEVDVTGSIRTPSINMPTKREVLKPLNFRKKHSNVKNDILVGYDVIKKTPESPDDVAYYFDLRVDEEIPPETLCSIYQRLKADGEELGHLDSFDLDCPDIAPTPFDVYGTNVTNEDIEECHD